MRLILALLMVLHAGSALAWGKTGHRVTGAIAEEHLSDTARSAIEDILGQETLAEASTWPDEMRSSPEHFWQEVAGPFHYVTVPPGKTYADVGAPPEGDAVTALERFAATLRDPDASLEEQQLALRFTVHIIGDLHQPLHVGNGEDRGGNDVRVQWFDEPTNLHRVWDTHMIEGERLSFTEWTRWLSAKITGSQARDWSDPDPMTWIGESAAIRETIYPDGERLGYDYAFHHLPIVKERLSQGGLRIAAYLNRLFDE